MEKSEYPVAKLYTPEPYWGCPNCGANTWGAIDPLSTDGYVYRCHGPTAMGNNDVTLSGCGTLFVLPPEFSTDTHDVDVDLIMLNVETNKHEVECSCGWKAEPDESWEETAKQVIRHMVESGIADEEST